MKNKEVGLLAGGIPTQEANDLLDFVALSLSGVIPATSLESLTQANRLSLAPMLPILKSQHPFSLFRQLGALNWWLKSQSPLDGAM
jgi:hypothetical protein